MSTHQIQERLYRLGNGACIAIWNGSFDIERLSGSMEGGQRQVLASGSFIDAALFDRADERVAQLKARTAHRACGGDCSA